jgi:hypothetical protein
MALGDLIVEDRGKVTGERVLDGAAPKLETLFTVEGNYRGIPCREVGTFTTVIRDGGVMYGEGQGVVMAKDGQGMVSWMGQGIGKSTGPGKVRFHGSIFFRTPPASNGGKLSYLNNMVGVFEYEGDEMGNCSSKVWEWK